MLFLTRRLAQIEILASTLWYLPCNIVSCRTQSRNAKPHNTEEYMANQQGQSGQGQQGQQSGQSSQQGQQPADKTSQQGQQQSGQQGQRTQQSPSQGSQPGNSSSSTSK